MKLCDKHHKLLTGEGECLGCTVENYQLILDRVTADKNLGNHVIDEQRNEIKALKAEIEELKAKLLASQGNIENQKARIAGLEEKYQFVISE